MPLGTVARLGLVALALSGLASCRSLTTNETAFISEQFRLDTARRRVDLSVVRIGCLDLSRGEALASARNEILADLGTQTVTTRNGVVAASTIDTQVAGTLLNGRALTIGNRIFFKSPLCQSDMAAGWPGAPINPVNDMALFGHEILHVWQWQNRRVTGYSLLKVLIEHIEHGNDVYKYDIVPGATLSNLPVRTAGPDDGGLHRLAIPVAAERQSGVAPTDYGGARRRPDDGRGQSSSWATAPLTNKGRVDIRAAPRAIIPPFP